MRKKIGGLFVAAVAAAALIGTPAFAADSDTVGGDYKTVPEGAAEPGHGSTGARDTRSQHDTVGSAGRQRRDAGETSGRGSTGEGSQGAGAAGSGSRSTGDSGTGVR